MTDGTLQLSRRYFFGSAAAGSGVAALSNLLEAARGEALPGNWYLNDGPHATAYTPLLLWQSRRGTRHRRALEPARRGRRRGPAGRPALSAQGEAGHLSVPVRRAVADGPVRLQAAAEGPGPDRASGLHPRGPAAHRHDIDPDHVS